MVYHFLKFWPILGLLKNVNDNKDPLIIALFSGENKPNDLNGYLRTFIDEYNDVVQNGFEFGGKHLQLKIHSVVCHTFARAFEKKDIMDIMAATNVSKLVSGLAT